MKASEKSPSNAFLLHWAAREARRPRSLQFERRDRTGSSHLFMGSAGPTPPDCGGLVASNVTTGQIDHRTVCGNRFYVSDGKVNEKQKHEYTCPHCGGLVASNVTTGQIDHRTVCGNRFYVSDGKVNEKQKHEYTCPHCGGLVASNVTTGQIDHRTVCGNRFYVSAGKVKDQKKNVQKTIGKK